MSSPFTEEARFERMWAAKTGGPQAYKAVVDRQLYDDAMQRKELARAHPLWHWRRWFW